MTATETPTPVPTATARTRGRAVPKFFGGPRVQGEANWIVKLAVFVICLLWLVPTVGLVVTSFRSTTAAQTSGWWTILKSPAELTRLTLQNYHGALSAAGMGDAFVNSVAISLPATIIPLMFAAFAAYAFTFMEFKGRETLFVLIIAMLVVPNQVAAVPMLKIYSNLGLSGTFAAAWLAHIGFGMSLAIYILRNYMATLPKSIVESAKVDGASHFQTFWRLIVPMSVPAIASFAIFQFLWVWNDLFVALIFIGPGANQPLTIALNSLQGQQGQGWQLITAGAVVTMAAPIAVFLALQRYFVRGLTAGSVKG